MKSHSSCTRSDIVSPVHELLPKFARYDKLYHELASHNLLYHISFSLRLYQTYRLFKLLY